MNKLKKYLAARLLREALKRRSPATIPRSGEAGAAVNCFSIFIDQDDEKPRWMLIDLDGETATCLEWDGASFAISRQVPFHSLPEDKFHITHYYGLWNIVYKGLGDFIIGRVTRGPYLKVNLIQVIGSAGDYVFNKRRLVSKKHTAILRTLIDKHLQGRGKFSTIDAMTDLYTIRWVLHPDRDERKRELQLYLDAMAEAGDLRKINGYEYEVTGKAIQTIERVEEEDARHVGAARLQIAALILSFVIAALTVVQANIVKLPVLFDWSGIK